MKEKPYDSYLKKVGDNLRKIRKEKGYSMENLANETEMEYRQLGRIERGEINTSIVSLLRLCETLKVELKDLFEATPITQSKTNSTTAEIQYTTVLQKNIDGKQRVRSLRK